MNRNGQSTRATISDPDTLYALTTLLTSELGKSPVIWDDYSLAFGIFPDETIVSTSNPCGNVCRVLSSVY